jgi:hypothetical protein
MLGFYNPNITDEEIHAELRKDPYLNNLAEGKDTPSNHSHLDEYNQAILREYEKTHPLPTADELKQEYQERFDKIKFITKEQSNNPSAYVKNIKDVLEAKKIVVLRCDGRATTGILNPSSNVKIDQMDYKSDYYKMAISIKK